MCGVQTQTISAFLSGDPGQRLKPALTPTVSAASCCKFAQLCHELCETQGHWVIQAGRELQMALVQPPAPSRVSYEVRLSCSDLYPARHWKPPWVETAQPPCSNMFFSLIRKIFSFIPSHTYHSALHGHCPWSCCHALTGRAWFQLLSKAGVLFDRC